MRYVLPLSILVAGAAALAACNAYGEPAASAGAAASASSGRQCIYTPNISGFRRGPGDTVVINTNSRDYYEFKTQPFCANRLDWEQGIALRSRSGHFICSGNDSEIYVPNGGMAAYCPVYDMRKLSPAEVTALRGVKR